MTNYKKIYGLDFKYEIRKVLSINNNLEKRVKNILTNEKIDTKYYETAMPIYLINTQRERTNNPGFYVPYISFLGIKSDQLTTAICKIFPAYSSNCQNLVSDQSQMHLNSMDTTYAFPYFVMDSVSNLDELKFIATHELFHHYQKYICGDGKYENCKGGKFTVETTANMAVVDISEITNTNSTINSHASQYQSLTDISIDKVGNGYGAFIFAHIYSENIPNGLKILFNSLNQEDTLNYLITQSGKDKYSRVLLILAEKLLTQDYDNILLKATYDGKLYIPKQYEKITKNLDLQNIDIGYSSIQYDYLNPKSYSKVDFSSTNSNIAVLLFGLKNGRYQLLETNKLSKKVTFSLDKYISYDEISFAIVNMGTTDLSYTYQLYKENEENLKEEQSKSGEKKIENEKYSQYIYNGSGIKIKDPLGHDIIVEDNPDGRGKVVNMDYMKFEKEQDIVASKHMTKDEILKMNITEDEKNALSKAYSMLTNFPGISYVYLVNYLENRSKFSHDVSVYAADNCGADWNEQALIYAKDLLSRSSFDNGIIASYNEKLLSFSLSDRDFTESQIDYALKDVDYYEQALIYGLWLYRHNDNVESDALILYLSQTYSQEQVDFVINAIDKLGL